MSSLNLRIVIWKDTSNPFTMSFGKYDDIVVLEEIPKLKPGQSADTSRFLISVNLNRATPDKALLILRDTMVLTQDINVFEQVIAYLERQSLASVVLLSKHDDQCSGYQVTKPIGTTDLSWSYPSQGEGFDAVYFSPDALLSIDTNLLIGGYGYDEVIHSESTSIQGSPLNSPMAKVNLVDAMQSWLRYDKITLSTINPNLFDTPNNTLPTCSTTKSNPIYLTQSTDTLNNTDITNTATIGNPNSCTVSNTSLSNVYETPSSTEMMLYSWWFWLIIFILLILILILILYSYRSYFPDLILIDK